MDRRTIRPCQPEDVERILEVWEDASRAGHPFLTEEFVALEKDRVRDVYLPSADTWVLEERRRILGFVSLIDNEVGALFVERDSQRRGVGRALLRFAVARRPRLELAVFEDNAGARAFYEAFGFVRSDSRLHEETGHRLVRMVYEGKG